MEIKLCPADPSYAAWWFEDRKDIDTLKYNPLAPSTIESLADRLAQASSNLDEFGTSDSFLWIAKSGDQPVGHVTLQNINRMMLTAEIGYGVSLHARGRGIATAEIRLVVKMVFNLTPIRKVIAFVHEENQPSRRVLVKTGFQQEGLLREHYLINGRPANEVIYGLLRSDFA